MIYEITFDSGEVQGYGGPGYHWIKAIYDNKVLDEVHGSEFDMGRASIELEQKWKKDWVESEFASAIKDKPMASPLCSICGDPCKGEGCSCLDKYFCKKCMDAGEVEKAKDDWERRQEDNKVEYEVKRQAEKKKEREDAERGFHWREGWYFLRLTNGDVRVTHYNSGPYSPHPGGYVARQFTIPLDEWASIVASVTQSGEIPGRWDQVRRFHQS